MLLCISVDMVGWGERHNAVIVLRCVFLRYEAVRYDGQGVTHQSILLNHIWFNQRLLKNRLDGTERYHGTMPITVKELIFRT
jgi:hypothetical protein